MRALAPPRAAKQSSARPSTRRVAKTLLDRDVDHDPNSDQDDGESPRSLAFFERAVRARGEKGERGRDVWWRSAQKVRFEQ